MIKALAMIRRLEFYAVGKKKSSINRYRTGNYQPRKRRTHGEQYIFLILIG